MVPSSLGLERLGSGTPRRFCSRQLETVTSREGLHTILAERVSGFGFRVLGFGFQVSDVGFRNSGFGFRVPSVGFRVARVPDFGFRVSGLEF